MVLTNGGNLILKLINMRLVRCTSDHITNGFLGSGATIDKPQQQNIDKEIKKWKEILTRILDIIRFLAKQNLAFRGHRESVH